MDKHNRLILNSEQLKDIKLAKVENSDKLIFDTIKLDNSERIKTFLEVEHRIGNIDIDRESFGLHVVTFANEKDKGIDFN